MGSERLDRVVVDPLVCGGRPTVRGHRVWVSVILGCLAEGWSIEEILDEYPGIERADVRACLDHSAHAENALAGEPDDGRRRRTEVDA